MRKRSCSIAGVAVLAICCGVFPTTALAQFGGGGGFGSGGASEDGPRAKLPPCDPPEQASIGVGRDQAAEDRIRKILEEVTVSDFFELPLDEAMRFFVEQHDVPILLDNRALRNAGVSTETPVTLQIEGVTLRSALRLILRDLELTYLIDDEVMVVTTPEVSEQLPSTRIYPVCDLIETGDVVGTADYGTLIRVITRTISPDSWEETGGTGRIEAGFGCVTITQTQEVHNEIEDLLTALRKVAMPGYRPAMASGVRSGFGGGGFGGGGRGSGGGGGF